MKRTCLECDVKYEVKDYRQKYCSHSCSAKVGNRKRLLSDDAKDKIRKSVIEYHNSKPFVRSTYEYVCEKCGEKFEREKRIKKGRYVRCDDCKRSTVRLRDLDDVTTILQFSKRTVSKIMKRLGFGCSRCGWDLCSCDIHHIISRRNGGTDEHSNLTYLCPNCHREAGSGLIEEFITLEKQIGEKWKKVYGVGVSSGEDRSL